ncbi:MAG: bifunctional oligoribonuclease/PAP phosphatase NrnA [Tissierellia bacterium]|nr:bifunctional oligoribonuclease/PAP phosphatase NrnA [Tissierellia bacterium]
MNNLKTLAKSFANVYEDAKSIVICSHMNPDGDNLGSILSIYHLAQNHGKTAYLVCDDEIPTAESFLPGLEDRVHSETLKDQEFDLMIILDCADLNRTGKAKNLLKRSKYSVNIDHHNTNDHFADLNIVDAQSPATAEIVFEIFQELNYKITKEIATCLFTGIATDTGSFKYDSVRPRTFEIASILLGKGINLNDITVHLFQSRTKEKTDLLLRALDTLEYYCDDKIGIVTVLESDITKAKARKSDADGIVEFVRDIASIELAILLKEKDDFIRLSTRSKKVFDCTKLASQFNGGGHIRASGGTIYNMTMDEAKKAVIAAAIKEMKK